VSDEATQGRLQAVVDTAVDGVILIDSAGTVLVFNPACERLFGYRAEEIVGGDVKRLMPSPYREEHDRYLESYLRTGEIGNAEILAEHVHGRPELRRVAEVIGAAGERGAELTRRLLAFSRRQALAPREIDCNRLLRGMRELLDRTLRDDVEVENRLADDLWSAFADPAQLESAILNLALNAQDAMPAGGRLSITTANMGLDERYHEHHPEVPPGPYVMITVTDDGEGMPADVLERVFEPFYTTKDVGKGSGLGLSMVYGFVKQSNGHVSIYSEPGLGTTVRLYLPAGTSALDDAERAAHDEDEALARGTETVLVVEDDPFVRAYAVSCLESLGYRALTASDAHEALARLERGELPDALFSDVVMPGGLDGRTLARRAQGIHPQMRVLLTSGYAVEAIASHGRLDPEIPFLSKPYRRPELARALRQVLDA